MEQLARNNARGMGSEPGSFLETAAIHGPKPTTKTPSVINDKFLPVFLLAHHAAGLIAAKSLIMSHLMKVADREGFEPSVPIKAHTLSKRAH